MIDLGIEGRIINISSAGGLVGTKNIVSLHVPQKLA